jgi:acyl transferase domain-containing protein
VGIVALKRLEDALADRDAIHAVVIGFGLNNDGASRAGFTAPGLDGQVAVYTDAIAMAGINPETIGYVECHGTGTPIGDPIEIAALTRAYRAHTQKKGFCAVGSVKTNIGHTDAAAGVAGFTKAVLALKHRLIPPSLHFEKPNPEIDFEGSPFYVNTELKEWVERDTPRRAAVTSLGIGGTNAHIILEEGPPTLPSSDSRPWQMLTLSAKTGSALEAVTLQMLRHLNMHPNDPMGDVAYTLHVGRQAFPHRRALICRDRADAIASLKTPTAENVFNAVTESESDPVVFLFPGQGAQYPHMAKDLYLNEPGFQRQIDFCAEILKSELRLDLQDLLYPGANGPASASDHLGQTQYAQPALFVVEYALARLWMEWGVRPEVMIGHSLGEYVAACLAGVFSVEDGLRLIAARGRLMQGLPRGSMISVLVSEEEIRRRIDGVRDLSVAAVNGPSISVVSGPCEAIADLQRRLEAQGVSCQRLFASHAYHSAMMDRIVDDFRNEVRRVTLRAPQIPFISNVSGTWISAAEAVDPNYWVRHLRHTVRFSDGIDELLRNPRRIFLEVGPGRALTSLILGRAASGKPRAIHSLPHPKDDPQNSLKRLLAAAGRLWAEGVNIDWEAFHSRERRQRLPLPTYPFERQQYRLPMSQIAVSNRDMSVTHSTRASSRHGELTEDQAIDSFIALPAAHARPNVPTAYVQPRTELERAICDVWRSAFGIAGIGVFDDFTELGGHSLLAIHLTARMQQLFGIDFTVTDLYQRPTVASLAEAVVASLMECADHQFLQEIIMSADSPVSDDASPARRLAPTGL